MSYSSARSSAQTAANLPPEQAVKHLAEAIYALSRAAEKDAKQLEQEISHLKSKLR